MKITTTVWNFVVKQLVWLFKITQIGAWWFKITPVEWRFSIDQQNEWTFKIVPAGYWILRDGTWDDNGIWIDTETWRDS